MSLSEFPLRRVRAGWREGEGGRGREGGWEEGLLLSIFSTVVGSLISPVHNLV